MFAKDDGNLDDPKSSVDGTNTVLLTRQKNVRLGYD